MNADRFRDKELGCWSSHPHWVLWRLRCFAMFAFGALVLLVPAAVLIARSSPDWRGMLAQFPRFVMFGGMMLAFALAGIMTQALCARLGKWRSQNRLEQTGDWLPAAIHPRLLLAAIVLGAVGPALLAHATPVTPAMRTFFQCFALFPLLGMILIITLVKEHPPTPSQQRQYRLRRRPIFLVLLSLVISLWMATLVRDLRSLGSDPGMLAQAASWLPGRWSALGQPFFGTAVLLPLAFFLFAAWELCPAVVPVESPQRSAARDARLRRKLSLWQRIRLWFCKLLGNFPRSGTVARSEPPAWLQAMREVFGQKMGPPERIRLAPDQISPDSPRTDLKHLFGIDVPSVDQVTVFERFERAYRELLEGGWGSGQRSADLLVVGNVGSGRTTALLACACYAAFVRGQRVLFLVPDSLRQQAVQMRVDAFLKRLQLGYYLQAASLDDDAVHRWLTGAEPIPHIIIGTVDSAERHLYGFQCLDSQLPALRRLVTLPEVIIVDDFMDFDDAQRSHLPFLIDKHRLLLAADQMPLQVVVSCRNLTELGQQILGARLFTVKQLDKNRSVVHVKPRQCGSVWRVRMEADDVPATLEQLVLWCLNHDLDVVLYRQGLEEDQRLNQQNALLAKAGRGRLALLSDLERPLLAPPPVEIDAIFYQQAAHEDVCLALRLHAGHDDTVIFSIGASGAAGEPVGRVLPAVADRSALPLLVTHLNSVARFLRPRAPLHADLCVRFGLPYREVPPAAAGVQGTDCRFDVDVWDEPDYGETLWPYLSLSGPVPRRQPVAVLAMPDPHWTVFASPDGRQLIVGTDAGGRSRASRRERARRARWFEGQAEFGDVGEIDLAHACHFHLDWYRRSIGLRAIEQMPDGQIRLIAQVWRGGGHDRHLPLYHLGWTLPDQTEAVRFWGGPDSGLRWFELRPDASVTVQARILGQMSEYGDVTDISAVEFEYPADLSGLVLAPAALDREQLGRTIGRALSGAWETGEDPRFWPALTGAFNYAARARIPGLHYFTRLLAFRLTDQSPSIGGAVVYFIEPTSSGRTASRLMAELLQDPAERADLFHSVHWFLNELAQTTAPPHRFLRQMAHLDYDGASPTDRLAEAQSLISTTR
jgi:hypothetical protein